MLAGWKKKKIQEAFRKKAGRGIYAGCVVSVDFDDSIERIRLNLYVPYPGIGPKEVCISYEWVEEVLEIAPEEGLDTIVDYVYSTDQIFAPVGTGYPHEKDWDKFSVWPPSEIK